MQYNKRYKVQEATWNIGDEALMTDRKVKPHSDHILTKPFYQCTYYIVDVVQNPGLGVSYKLYEHRTVHHNAILIFLMACYDGIPHPNVTLFMLNTQNCRQSPKRLHHLNRPQTNLRRLMKKLLRPGRRHRLLNMQ
jgi:hypothetical protein